MVGKRHEPRFPTEKRDVTSKNIGGISDLVVWAPIKEGFIDAFGNVTYASRLRIVTEALNKLRKNVREFQLTEPFADSTKRILSLLDFRIGIVERDIYGFGGAQDEEKETLRPRQYMYLTATFDGPWEPYMRQIWRPLGNFLDLVLCNCEGYLDAYTTDFEKYIQWVRDHSLDTGMFYLVMGQTVKDHLYLRETERIERETEDAHGRDVEITTHYSRTPEEEALAVRDPDGTIDFVTVIDVDDDDKVKSITQGALTLALEALNVLYQLTRYYPADSIFDAQGEFLWRATRDILEKEPLKKYVETLRDLEIPKKCADPKHASSPECQAIILKKKIGTAIWRNLRDQLEWYAEGFPKFVKKVVDNPDEDQNVQKGLLTSYDADGETIKNSAMLLLKITDIKKVQSFLHPFLWSWEGRKSLWGFFANLALTYKGLEKLPFSAAELRALPKEFRQGMEERAPHIGDVYHNHPQRWLRPRRNGQCYEAGKTLPRVSLYEIDMVMQLRVPIRKGREKYNRFIEFEKFPEPSASFKGAKDIRTLNYPLVLQNTFGIDSEDVDLPDPVRKYLYFYVQILNEITDVNDPEKEFIIYAFIELLRKYGDELGVEILSIQSGHRPDTEEVEPKAKSFVPASTPTDHFGFKDGISQPFIPSSGEENHPMAIYRGDLILGHSTQIDDPPSTLGEKSIQRNGSFLAIRKMRQDVEAFEQFLQCNKHKTNDDESLLAAKMMGRNRDGTPLIKAIDNNFDYEKETDGTICPFISHIRRANPRDVVHKRKAPKILRRGMTYGNRIEKDPTSTERGSIFIAYCSNLAEQYELIQRWVNGGNSTDIVSSQSDPIIAPPPRDGADVFKFPMKGPQKTEVLRFNRYPERPFVQLEWGLYAFAPGKNTLLELIKRIHDGSENRRDGNQVARGKKVVEQIEGLPKKNLRRQEWKTILEDFLTKDPAENNTTAEVMAFIREKHNGVYKIPDGVLGADNDSENIFEEMNENPVLLVAEKSTILDVLSQPKLFSSKTIGKRLDKVFGEHYIGMDPKPGTNKDPYLESSWTTNKTLLDYSELQAYYLGYGSAAAILNRRKEVAIKLFRKDKYKIELTRELFAISLAAVCHYWFGIPDDMENPQYFMPGGFPYLQTARNDENRLPRCPGDFLAPSRGSFYPRPTPAIASYAEDHGPRLKKAVDKLTSHWKQCGFPQDSAVLAKSIYEKVKDFDLLGRNLVGAMIGMLPSSEASLRAATYDWAENDKLWQIQGDLVSLTNGKTATFEQAKEIVKPHLIEAMSKRPAPDLLYRTATKPGVLGGKAYKKGDTIILALVSALQADLDAGKSDIFTVFGDYRDKKCPYNTGRNPHACPATDMAMGNLLGIITALLQAGEIQTLPASLIWEISFKVEKIENPDHCKVQSD